ncbi:MAG: TIM barrel protein [Clostridia bacterium]|nr:TIM barrel protein [Clostridia bacterium]
MKKKRALCLLLTFLLLFTATVPALAAGAGQAKCLSVNAGDDGNRFTAFFKTIYDKLASLWNRFKTIFAVSKEEVKNTMNRNAIHMLRSVTDTIGDSFIITTEDGKVIVIDGGHKTETDYFVEYLKAATGQCRPHIDAWFLSHPHDDHCEVFLEVVENRGGEVTFDKVYANFPEDPAFYEGYDEWAVTVTSEYNRLKPLFADRAARLAEGDVFHVGAAKFTVFYTFNPEWKNCNESSTIMRMDLGGTSVMFNGDAGTRAGDYVVEKYADSGLLDCDCCKMAHHGQDGVGRNFYEAVSPEVCLWPTPTWVYENTNGNLKTFETRAWVEELGVKKEYKSFEGSVVIGMKPRIVTTTDVFEEGYDAATAVDRLAALGYEGVDMGFDYWTFDGSPFLADDYLAWAKGLKERADAAGIIYTHAHAPGEADSEHLGRSIKATAALGARYLVVHPIWRDKNGKTINSKLKFLQVNAEAIRQWLPMAEEYGVVLLSENILWGASSDPRVIAELVKKVGSDRFGWCFDVGHAWCSGYAPDVLKKCAVVPLSLHIQDNDGSGDQHFIPGDGTIDWKAFTQTLREVGYLGDCVMEAHHQSLEAPDEERDEILARLLEKARELRAELR